MSNTAGAHTTGTVTKTTAAGGALALLLGCPVASAAVSSGAVLTPTLTAVEYHFPGDNGNYLVADGPFRVGNVFGANSGQPAPPGAFQGSQAFDVYNDGGDKIGTVDALVSHGMSSGNPNMQVLITGTHPDDGVDTGTAAGDMPNVGSVFNWGGADPTDPSNVYMSLAGGAPDPLTGPPTTGNVVVNDGLLGLVGVFGFDGTAHVDVHTALVRDTDFRLPNGDYVIASPDHAETYDSITNTAPYATAVQGTQIFEVHDGQTGDLVGTFAGRTVSTADLVGGHSYEILVLGDQADADGDPIGPGGLGSAAGQLPTDGSVFNMLYLFSPDAYNIYTDYHGTGADGANEINQLWNLFGTTFTTTPAFDAVAGFTDGTNLFETIPYLSGATITPVAGTELYTGINGMPNGGLSGTSTVVQGIKTFTYTDADGSHTFNADVTTFGNQDTTSVTLYVNPDQFDYGSGPAADPLTDITDAQLADLLNGVGPKIAGGDLPGGIDPGYLLDYADHGWYRTLTVDSNPLDTDADVVHELSIPWLGINGMDVDGGLLGWLPWLGITF